MQSKMAQVIVFGKNGQVANALSKIMANTYFVSSNECDFSDSQNIQQFLENLTIKPKIIINAAAYTKVDLAETERELSMQINAEAVKIIANYCNKSDIILVHYSTDYVFDGISNIEYKETETNCKPINHYGVTKLMAERYIIDSRCKHYIVRISWVFSEIGINFVKIMIKLMQEKDELNVINDQIGSPTYAGDISNITKLLIEQKPEFGIYHFTNEGYITWYDFACEIKNVLEKQQFALKVKKITPILTKEYPTLATRPLNTKLNKNKIINILNIKLIDYKKSLKKCVINYINDNK